MNYPIQPLSPIERLGWLVHFSTLKCKKNFSASGSQLFTVSKRYSFTASTVKVRRTERRARRDGIRSPVHLTGPDLYIKIADESARDHRFLARPATRNDIIHDFAFLVEHFEIPEIPDLASLHPKKFQEYKRRLRALEK